MGELNICLGAWLPRVDSTGTSGAILMNKPVWLAVDPADESGDCTIVTALVYRITGSQQYHTFTLIDFRAFILMQMYLPGHAYPA
jgi:hypothetical protein